MKKKSMTKEMIQGVTLEETKALVLGGNLARLKDLSSTLTKLGTKTIPKYHLEKSKKRKDEILDEIREASLEIMRGFETETHVALMEAVDVNYRFLAKEFTDQIIKEYSCTMSVEKALAEVIANAYIRILDNSRRLNMELNVEQITPNRNIYFANLSKQLDRAHHQFSSALLNLKQLKQPAFEVNVKATNAYLSQNQQINVNENNESTNIEA